LSSNWYYNGGDKYVVTGPASQYVQNQGVHQWFNAPSGTAGNAISFTQAMTLDASGNLLVGTTSASFGGRVIVSNDGTATQTSLSCINTFGSGTMRQIDFFTGTNTSRIGSIESTTTLTLFNTSSDYRLKNITGPVTTSGAYIDSLKPVEGTWKADGSTFVGLIAHEVQEASRTTVATGTKDGKDMQGMDYSSAEIIANLIAERQSLRARVAQLGSKP
jgi:hypothetical protein